MSRPYKILLVFFCVVLEACAQTVRTRVNSFRAPEAMLTGATVAVVGADSAQQQSLEFGLYRDVLERTLIKKGFTLAPVGTAQVHALLSYSVNRVSHDNDLAVRTGVMAGAGRGSFGTNVMILDGARNTAWFERKLSVVLERNTPERARIYEINAYSEGGCGVLSAVIPDMVAAVFSEFPMANGAIKYVSVPVSEKCK
ncbi:MAG: hypothetical protein RL497_241 [Pseudomonadota bacterium]|jgi:hypothetical protein